MLPLLIVFWLSLFSSFFFWIELDTLSVHDSLWFMCTCSNHLRCILSGSWAGFVFSSFCLLFVAAGLFFFPSLYLGNGSEQTNIVIYGAHWFIFVVSKLLFLGSIGLSTTKLDVDKLDRTIYMGKSILYKWYNAIRIKI